MRIRRMAGGLVLLLVLGTGGTVTAAPPRALVGVTLVDGSGRPPLKNAVLVWEGERIVAVGPRTAVYLPEGTETIDGTGLWVVPGLVDAHVHFFQSGGLFTRPDVIDLRDIRPYEEERAWIRRRLPETLRRYLCSGVTAVVDVGGPVWNFSVRSAARDQSEAPRVAVAGPLITTHTPAPLMAFEPPFAHVEAAQEARQAVRAQLTHRPDLIKIWFIVRPGDDVQRLLQIYRAAIDEAHAHGVRVAVHATQLETARAAVQAGADILVHSVTDRVVDDAFVRLLREKKVIYTPTLVVWEGYGRVLDDRVKLSDIEQTCGDPEVIATWSELRRLPPERRPRRSRLERFRKRFRSVLGPNLVRLVRGGVTVAVGTDAGNIGTLHGPAIHREMALMAEAGLTPMEILVAATRHAARVFTPDPRFGTLEPGKYADFLVLNADPLADIGNLKAIRAVVRGGRWFERSRLVVSPPSTAACPEPEAVSLLGRPLCRPVLPETTRQKYQALLDQARRDRDQRPQDPETWIWLGRRLAYLGRYREAIAVYTRALEQFPAEPRLYRHRGHRYLTLRQFERARADLETAARLTADQPDQVEPDGIPNPANQPRSTLKTNISYHLGLAHYLMGQFGAAVAAYRKGLQISPNDDMRVAFTYWLVLALKRTGRHAEARQFLARIAPQMEILENHLYHRLLLYFQGRLGEADLVRSARTDLDRATLGYGIGMWHLLQGDRAGARRKFQDVVAGPFWPAFGHLAAEVELRRMNNY